MFCEFVLATRPTWSSRGLSTCAELCFQVCPPPPSPRAAVLMACPRTEPTGAAVWSPGLGSDGGSAGWVIRPYRWSAGPRRRTCCQEAGEVMLKGCPAGVVVSVLL